jgi:hypothetical protein
MFPVLWEDVIFIASGGTQAAYSQSKYFYSFNLAAAAGSVKPSSIPVNTFQLPQHPNDGI